MRKYAVIDAQGVVRNIILWDGAAEWRPGEGWGLIELDGTIPCNIGWTFEAGVFVEPPVEQTTSEGGAGAGT